MLGERHPDTATSLNNLAGLLQAQGDYAAAKPLFEQALAINKAMLGERHPHYRHQPEQPGEAAESRGTTPPPSPSTSRPWRSARRSRRAHPDTAPSLNNLALLLEAQGDYAAAKPLYEQALAIRKAVWASATPTPPPA